MSQTDLTRFRRRCGQFRWLAVFMVTTVGGLITLIHFFSPILLWLRDGIRDEHQVMVAAIQGLPAVFYLFGVWSIGRAMGELGRGRMFQPTVADALRRVGLALGFGGVFSVFLMSNLLRALGDIKGGYLNFDVASMTLGMIGGALFLLGRVIDQAGQLQAELDEMI